MGPPPDPAERLPRVVLPGGPADGDVMAGHAAVTEAGADLARTLRSACGRPGDAVVLEGYGLLPFRPVAVVHPVSEEELAAIVAVAREAKVAVRAVGALHSQAPVPYTDGICVVLDRYDQVV